MTKVIGQGIGLEACLPYTAQDGHAPEPILQVIEIEIVPLSVAVILLTLSTMYPGQTTVLTPLGIMKGRSLGAIRRAALVLRTNMKEDLVLAAIQLTALVLPTNTPTNTKGGLVPPNNMQDLILAAIQLPALGLLTNTEGGLVLTAFQPIVLIPLNNTQEDLILATIQLTIHVLLNTKEDLVLVIIQADQKAALALLMYMKEGLILQPLLDIRL